MGYSRLLLYAPNSLGVLQFLLLGDVLTSSAASQLSNFGLIGLMLQRSPLALIFLTGSKLQIVLWNWYHQCNTIFSS